MRENDLQLDPRWRRLRDKPWKCSSCGESHAGAFDLACGKPDAWPGSEIYEPNSAALTSKHFLSEDFCIQSGEHYFVRCVLSLPIIGGDGAKLGFGVWSTLSEKNFQLYATLFDEGEMAEFGPWFGWFSNSLTGYPETFNLKCQVHPQNNRQRPHIELEPTDHPLALEQRNGITFERLLEIYAVNGHDLRGSLTD